MILETTKRELADVSRKHGESLREIQSLQAELDSKSKSFADLKEELDAEVNVSHDLRQALSLSNTRAQSLQREMEKKENELNVFTPFFLLCLSFFLSRVRPYHFYDFLFVDVC